MATQVTLNSGAVASAGALALQTNGTTEAVSISTGQVATLAQNPVLTSGTANGVAYLNGSKVLTTGSALVFDGTNLGVGVTPSAWGGTGVKALDVAVSTSIAGSAGSADMYGNAYYNGSNFVFKANGYAFRYQQNIGSGFHAWSTSNNGSAGGTPSFTQAMTLDASGRLGLGTTSPTTPLQIQTAAATGVNSIFCTGSTTAYNFWTISNTSGNARIGVDSSSGGALATGSSAYSTVIGSSSATSLHLISNGAVQATIDTSGNLLLGTTTKAQTWGIFSLRNSSNAAGKAWGIGPDTNNAITIYNQGGVGQYMADGATSWTATSDERFKTDLIPIENAAQKVSTLRAVIGRFKTDEEGVSRSFLIAQDVQAVLPQAVDASDPEKLGVQYTDVIPLLVAAIKEQQALIQTLTDRISALESA